MKLSSSSPTRVLLIATALTAAVTATAAEPEDIIKYRQRVMSSQGAHMGALFLILQGRVEYRNDVGYHADALAHSLTNLTALFPEGSDFGDTEALPAVWEKRAAFEKVAADAQAAGAQLKEAGAGGDMAALGAAFDGVAKQCKACHDDFREER